MKKVVVASLLACAAVASGTQLASAQVSLHLGFHAQAAAAAPAGGQVQMGAEEYAVYNPAMTLTDPKAKAAAIEAYLKAYPNSAVKIDTIQTLMITYSSVDPVKTLATADMLLQLDPNNIRALAFEVYFRKAGADAQTDPAAKQAALDSAATYAQKGLTVTKPASMSDADFKTIQGAVFPSFYSAIGTAALNKKNTATAIDAFKKELASVPVAQTQAPGPILQDTYFLGLAYLQSTPSDLIDCSFYVSRFVAYAPEPYKTQIAPTAKYCYKKYHGTEDGYAAVMTAAQANLTPPDGFSASVTPAPTPAEKIHKIIETTPDLATLATSDKELVFQYGSAEDAGKVWATVKGKTVEIPDALVITSSPTVLTVAVSEDAVQAKTADFTFNLKPLETGTPAEKKAAAAAAAATAVGSKVTLTGTYDSFTPTPVMITMADGAVVLKKAPAATKAPVRRAAHK